ncbi:response regulator transcription factor [Cysteiniphilum litorale]|uniref:response regulator transcription factor n=1 Tax=Cysteiniphilum litorale TaxID=2056700 RepID=UPI003F883BBE
MMLSSDSTIRLYENKVLIVDDDHEMVELLQKLLKNNGFSVSFAHSLSGALTILNKKVPDIILLDVMLPDGNGIDACQQIQRNYNIPIIMLTALDSDVKKILSYELGACQYITKPFNSDVLVAQIKSALRQFSFVTEENRNKRYVHFGHLVLDLYDRYLINAQGVSIELSNTEYDLLRLLIDSNRKILSRNDVTKALFRREYDGSDRAVDIIVGRLRKKVEEDTANPKIIKTVHGYGYIMLADIYYSDQKMLFEHHK